MASKRRRDGGLPDPGRALPVGGAADQVHGPGRLQVGEPESGRAPQVQRRDVELGEARQHGVACRAPGRRRPTATTGRRSRTDGVRLLGRQPEVAPESCRPTARPGGTRPRPAAPPGRRRAPPPPCHRRPAVPTTPVRRDVPTDPATIVTTLTERARCTPLVVVVFSAKRTSAWLPSSTSTMQASAPRGVRGRDTSLDELLGRDHRRPPSTLSVPTPRGC